MADRLLTAREVADIVGMSTETILRWRREGELPAFKLPSGAIRFREAEVETWLQQRATPRRGALTTTPGAAQPATVPLKSLTTTEDEET